MSRKAIIFWLFLVGLFIVGLGSFSYATSSNDEHWAGQTLNELMKSNYAQDFSAYFSLNNMDEKISVGEISYVVNRIFFEESANSLQEELKLLQRHAFLTEQMDIEENITREEVSVIVCQLLNLDVDREEKTLFEDDEDITFWLRPYVAKLQEQRIVIGYPDNSFRSANIITKAEFITIINRCRDFDRQELITQDEDVSSIEIGMLKYEDENVSISPINDALIMFSGDTVQIAVSVPENVADDDVSYFIHDLNIAQFDEELLLIEALQSGDTQLDVYTKNKEYFYALPIIVK